MILVFGGNAGGRLLLSDPNTTPWLHNECIFMRFRLVNSKWPKQNKTEFFNFGSLKNYDYNHLDYRLVVMLDLMRNVTFPQEFFLF